jgi:hydrogenase nickel incorporation protein HypA/HybF
VLDVVLNAAQEAGAERIRAINLVIGDLSSIVDESVQFYFDFLSRETPAEGATLHFRREPGTVICHTCGHEFVASVPLKGVCPACNGERLRVMGGSQFYVESIEVDDDDTSCEGYSERE